MRRRLSQGRGWRLGVGVLVLAALLGGCGEDERGSPEDRSAASAASEFRRAADRICRVRERELRAEVKARYPGLNVEDGIPLDAPRVLAREIVVPALRTMIAGLEQLEPPPGGRARVEAMLAALERQAARTERDPELIAEPKSAAAKRIDRLAAALGLHVCGA